VAVFSRNGIDQARVERWLRSLRFELALEPILEASGDDSVDIAGARAEGETVQQMGRGLALAEAHGLPR